MSEKKLDDPHALISHIKQHEKRTNYKTLKLNTAQVLIHRRHTQTNPSEYFQQMFHKFGNFEKYFIFILPLILFINTLPSYTMQSKFLLIFT